MQDAPGGAENTRCHTDKMTTMSQGKLSPIFVGAPRCGGALEMSMSCMCEPVETAQSLGDDTHAVGTRTKWAREHGLQHFVWSIFFVGGLQAWPIDLCSNKDAGKREHETPTLHGKRNRRNPKETTHQLSLFETHQSPHVQSLSLFSSLSRLSL